MVVDLDLPYLYLASVLTSASASTSTSASEVNISNSHNSLIFQARRLKFCMVVDIGNTNRLYHAIPYHKIPNHTKYQIFQMARTQTDFKLGAPNFAWY